jgi:hypothetical protein
VVKGEILEILFCSPPSSSVAQEGFLVLTIANFYEVSPDTVVAYTESGQYVGPIVKLRENIDALAWSGEHLFIRTLTKTLKFSLFP